MFAYIVQRNLTLWYLALLRKSRNKNSEQIKRSWNHLSFTRQYDLTVQRLVAVRFSRLVVAFRKRIEETFEIDTVRSDKQSKRWKGQRQGGWKVAENRTLLYNQSAGYLPVAEITKLLEGFVSGWKARMWVSDCEQLVEHEIRALVSNNVPVEVTFQCLTAGTRVQVEERTGKQISD